MPSNTRAERYSVQKAKKQPPARHPVQIAEWRKIEAGSNSSAGIPQRQEQVLMKRTSSRARAERALRDAPPFSARHRWCAPR